MTETTKGLRLFDLTRLERTAAEGDDRYALPEIARYRPAGDALRFSFTSVDAAGSGLLVGEYVDAKPGARLVRWPLGPDGLLAQESAVGGVGDRRTRTSRAWSRSGSRC